MRAGRGRVRGDAMGWSGCCAGIGSGEGRRRSGAAACKPGAAALAVVVLTAAAWSTPVRADTPAELLLTYDAVMDMVRPQVIPNLHVHHNLKVTISRQGDLFEHRNRNAGSLADSNQTLQILGSTGDEEAYAQWQVAPDGRLVRLQHDPQSTRTMTVTLLPDGTCRLDIVDELKPGFTEYAFLRISTHKLGYFSSYRVVKTSCTMR